MRFTDPFNQHRPTPGHRAMSQADAALLVGTNTKQTGDVQHVPEWRALSPKGEDRGLCLLPRCAPAISCSLDANHCFKALHILTDLHFIILKSEMLLFSPAL